VFIATLLTVKVANIGSLFLIRFVFFTVSKRSKTCLCSHLCQDKMNRQVGVAVMLYTCIGRCFVWISAGTQVILTEILCCMLTLHTNIRIVPRLGHDCFLPNPFQFIVHQTSHHLMLQSLRYWQSYKVRYKNKELEWISASESVTDSWSDVGRQLLITSVCDDGES
jgi:hypothetical protein